MNGRTNEGKMEGDLWRHSYQSSSSMNEITPQQQSGNDQHRSVTDTEEIVHLQGHHTTDITNTVSYASHGTEGWQQHPGVNSTQSGGFHQVYRGSVLRMLSQYSEQAETEREAHSVVKVGIPYQSPG